MHRNVSSRCVAYKVLICMLLCYQSNVWLEYVKVADESKTNLRLRREMCVVKGNVWTEMNDEA